MDFHRPDHLTGQFELELPVAGDESGFIFQQDEGLGE